MEYIILRYLFTKYDVTTGPSLHKISGMLSDMPFSYLRIPDPELNF